MKGTGCLQKSFDGIFISSYLCVDLLCDNQGNTILLLSHRRHLLPESEFVFLALFDKAEIKSYLFCFKS